MGAINLSEATLDSMGLKWDRRWMLVDKSGEFITARKHPELLRIQPELDQESGNLRLHIPNQAVLDVPPASADMPKILVKVWEDKVDAIHLDSMLDKTLSKYIGTHCQLVYIDDNTVREVDQDYASPGDRTGFSDGFPLLLISKASLDDLNARMEQPLPMKRFRPNIVVEDCDAYEEDQWLSITSNQVELTFVKPCSRCIMTTANPETGKRDGKEPLKTLQTYRQQGNKVFFGQNLIHRNLGDLKVGDTIKINNTK